MSAARFGAVTLYVRPELSWTEFLDFSFEAISALGADAQEVSLFDRANKQRTWKPKTAVKRDIDLGNFGVELDQIIVHSFFEPDEHGVDKSKLQTSVNLVPVSYPYDEPYWRIDVKYDLEVTSLNDPAIVVSKLLGKCCSDFFGFSNRFKTIDNMFGYLSASVGGDIADKDRTHPLFKELQWYKRLAQPVHLMANGCFRNVYEENILNESQMDTLRWILSFEGSDVPVGSIEKVAEHSYFWNVPDNSRKAVFEKLEAANKTLYRNFFDSKELY